MPKYSYNPDTSPWQWCLADHTDVADIVAMAEQHFQLEIDALFVPEPLYYAYNVDTAITRQHHYRSLEQVIVARDKTTGVLMAYAWLGRSGHTVWSQDELAEAKIAHVDLALSSRTRITLVAQILQHWCTWCTACEIPVLVSTSIRSDQTAFMRLHQHMGFVVRGAIGYKRIKEFV